MIRQQQNEKEAGRRRVREAREKLLQVAMMVMFIIVMVMGMTIGMVMMVIMTMLMTLGWMMRS